MTLSTRYDLGKGFKVDPLQELGKGQFGNMVLGEDANHHKVAAKQLMYRSRNGNSNNSSDRITNECQNLLDIKYTPQNTHIIKYLHYKFIQGQHWVVMEYCNEGNLEDYLHLKSGSMLFSQRIQIMTQALDGVSALHAFQPAIIHQKITPKNILLKTENGKNIVKISDFSLVKTFKGEGQKITAYSSSGREASEFTSEEFYKAPEYFTKEQTNTSPYDVFCLGLVFYALYCFDNETEFEPVFTGHDETPIAMLMVENTKYHQVSFPSTSYAGDVENNILRVVQNCIESMLKYSANNRKDLCDVLKLLTNVSPIGHTDDDNDTTLGTASAADDSAKNVVLDTSGIYEKFVQFLKHNGPTKYTDPTIRELFLQLTPEQMDQVLSKGSIKNFLKDCSSIDSNEDVLQYSSRQEYKNECDLAGLCQIEDKHLRVVYVTLQELTEKDEIGEFITDVYEDKKSHKIYVSVYEDHISQVENRLKQLDGFDCMVIIAHHDAETEWLNGLNIQKCIGPGSIIVNDPQLQTLKGMNESPRNIFTVEDAFIGKTHGSFGCIALNTHNKKLYVLSAKHVINKTLNDENNPIDEVSNSNSCMITALKDSYPVELPCNFERTVSLQDCQFISNAFVGILGTVGGKTTNIVDAVLFGPLVEQFLSNHVETTEHQMQQNLEKLHVVKEPIWKLNRQFVKKIGATTGETKGIIISGKRQFTTNFVTSASGEQTTISGRIFVVTSCDNDTKEPHIDGKFADGGDSGSVVLLDDEDLPGLNAIGIIHGSMAKYMPATGICYRNAIICTHLYDSIESLKRRGNFADLQLYYHYFTPHLCLGSQKLHDNGGPGVEMQEPSGKMQDAEAETKQGDSRLCQS